MLKKTERAAVLAFLRYHGRGFHAFCYDSGIRVASVSNKVEKHKSEANRFRAMPLTIREGLVLSAFLSNHRDEFRTWCATFEVSPTEVRTALKGMTGS